MAYQLKTTFLTDFNIADKFGADAVQDTYDRAFKEWKNDYVYLTELVMVLNWSIFKWYEVDDELAILYNRLWQESDEYAMEHLKGKELDYYIRTTD